MKNKEKNIIKISTIMPVYNTAQFIRKTLDSILNQSLKELELICVDDGSTDGSDFIIEEYAKTDSRIKLIRQKNAFAGCARNNGLKYASGEYVHFMDSDDWLEENAYELLYNQVKENKEDMCVFFHYTYDNETGEVISKPHYINGNMDEGASTVTNFSENNKYFIYNAVVPWNKIYKRSFLEEYGFQFSSLQCANDRSFYYATIVKAKSVKIYNEFLLYYRINNEKSVASIGRLKNFNCHFGAMEEILNGGKDLSAVEYNMLVDVCMKDMFSFFNKATGTLKIGIWKKMESYLSNLPIAYSENHEISNYYNWYDDYKAISSPLVPKERVVISLTSFPPRIPMLHECIESLLMQSLHVEKIILWLAEEQFPNKNDDLPESLLSLLGDNFEIRYCEDIKSYKKLIPTLRLNLDAIIITTDDDIIYNFDMAKNLYLSYLTDKKSVHAHRVTKMFVWGDEVRNLPGGSHFYSGTHPLNKLVGVGGVLYPVGCFYKDILNSDLFMKLAPTNDDQWFWCMANLNGYYVRSIKNKILKLTYIEGSQNEALTNINDKGQNLFNIQLNNLRLYYKKWDEMLTSSYPENYSKVEFIGTLHEELDKMRQQLYKIKDGFSQDVMESEGLAYPKENYEYYLRMKKSDYPRSLKKWALRVRGKEINLSRPATFSEKIQWMKLNKSTKLKAKLSDKYEVRKWIKNKIEEQYLIPILGVYKRFKDIDFDKLPNKFVLKCNHGSGYNVIVTDKQNLNLAELEEKVNKWLMVNFAYKVGLELHYRYIKPRIVIEQFMENQNGDLWDYKFLCINGRVELIWVDTDRYAAHRRTLFDTKWQQLPYVLEYPHDEIPPRKPEKLDEMIKLAEKLSVGFSQVRVDFYLLNDGTIKFGEMTFTSGSGMDRFMPQYYDRVLGEKITLDAK